MGVPECRAMAALSKAPIAECLNRLKSSCQPNFGASRLQARRLSRPA